MATEKWFLWHDGAHRPAWNMSTDEILLATADRRRAPLLRFYQWDRSAVTIGYVQSFDAVTKTGVEVVRRPTGGGVVDHEQDFTYSVAIPPSHWLVRLNRMESYHYINRAVGYGLSQLGVTPSMAEEQIPRHVDRTTMVCFEQPTRYDVLANDQKVAGSAQRRTRDGILHQGSVLLDELDTSFDNEQLQASIEAGFVEVMGAEFSPFTPDRSFLDEIAAAEQERYSASEWIQRR